MSKKKVEESSRSGRPKLKITRYIDADLWARLKAYADLQEVEVSDTALVEAALRRFLDAEEGKK